MTSADWAKKATISAEKWANYVHTHPTYLYKTTAWYHALLALEAETHPPAPPPPAPQPDPLQPYRKLLFMAQSPLDALQAGPGWTVLFTADPAYDSWATASAADQMRAAGQKVGVWYVPTEVSRARAFDVKNRLGADLWLGQCETADQFNATLLDGVRGMVGSLSALTDSQLALVAAGKNVVVNECYRNCSPGQQPDWRQANAGVPGNCVAVYHDSTCAYTPISDYVKAGLFDKDRDSVYGVGLQAADWACLR